MNALIIDDEPHAVEALKAMIELYCPEVNVYNTASSFVQALKSIKTKQPDLVFLDITIGNESGFEFLECLSNVSFPVIFTTAHSKYASQAFRVNALDYLVKPIVPDELQEAVQKVKSHKVLRDLSNKDNSTDSIHSNSSNQQLAVYTHDGISFLNYNNILHLTGSGNYTTFHLDSSETILVSKNLGHFAKILPSKLFYRSHQSHIVQLKAIRKIHTKEGNIIELSNGTKIPLTSKRKEQLINLLL